MTWMNRWEIEEVLGRFDDDTPNLRKAADTLYQLMLWTNSNSDGWPYWQKPANAASRLMDLLHDADRWDPTDITDADLNAALRPIKAFLTRQGVGYEVVGLGIPTPIPTSFRVITYVDIANEENDTIEDKVALVKHIASDWLPEGFIFHVEYQHGVGPWIDGGEGEA